MAYRKLGRDNKHRRSMLSTLTKQVIVNESITTTETRAKEVRKFVDKMITYGKKGDLVSRRKALAFLNNVKEIVSKVFDDLAKRYENRNGGYTQILKLGERRGYDSLMVILKLVEEPVKVEASAIFSEEKIDKLTSVVMEFADGKKAAFTCGMTLATDQDRRLERLEIDGTKGSITGTKFAFNGEGELSYTIRTAEGQEEVKTVEVPQNYRLEVEQFGRCIDENEKPAVTEEFSLKNARLVERILEEIGY